MERYARGGRGERKTKRQAKGKRKWERYTVVEADWEGTGIAKKGQLVFKKRGSNSCKRGGGA